MNCLQCSDFMVLFSAVAGLCYEQDMIVEAVAFLLNLPDLQVEDLESEAIMNDLKEALAAGAGVTEDLVHILGVYAGSVVVDSQIVFPEAHRDAAVSFREALETNAITEVFKDGAPTLGLTAATVVRNHQYLGHRTACVMFLLWVCTLQAHLIIERAVAELMELPFILLDDDCFLSVDSTITLLYLEAFTAPARLILFHSVVHIVSCRS